MVFFDDRLLLPQQKKQFVFPFIHFLFCFFFSPHREITVDSETLIWRVSWQDFFDGHSPPSSTALNLPADENFVSKRDPVLEVGVRGKCCFFLLSGANFFFPAFFSHHHHRIIIPGSFSEDVLPNEYEVGFFFNFIIHLFKTIVQNFVSFVV